MILSFDPPRHAMLIHLGKRFWNAPLETRSWNFGEAQVQVALDSRGPRSTLVAIHFVRHHFRLPFVRPDNSVDDLQLDFGRTQHHHFFHLTAPLEGCREWMPTRGLAILLSADAGYPTSDGGSELLSRPSLLGFRVDPRILDVQFDTTEFRIEMSADNLKDVPVTLFVEGYQA